MAFVNGRAKPGWRHGGSRPAIVLERTKPGYTIYIPECLRQARRMLAHRGDFPELRKALAL